MKPGPEEEQFFVLRGGIHPWAGPYRRSDLEEFSGTEALIEGDLVWSTKLGSWQPAHRFASTGDLPPVAEIPVPRVGLGGVIRKMAIGTAAIAFSFWGLCWLSVPPPDVEVDPFVKFDLDDDFDVPLNAIDASQIDNAIEPVSTPENFPSPGDDWTENSG